MGLKCLRQRFPPSLSIEEGAADITLEGTDHLASAFLTPLLHAHMLRIALL